MKRTTRREAVLGLALAAALVPWATLRAEDARPASTQPFTYEEYLAAKTPGSEHRALEALAGDLELSTTFWPASGAPPERSVMPARRTLGLEGRVLRLEVGPDPEGFRGSGMMGFDNVAGRHWYVWTDTTTTGVARVSGRLEADGTGFLEGTRPTPLGDTPFRIRITSEDDAEVHRYYEASPSGKEVLFLELRYRPVG